MGRKKIHVDKNNRFSPFSPCCLQMDRHMYLCIQYMLDVGGGKFSRGQNLQGQRKAVAQIKL